MMPESEPIDPRLERAIGEIHNEQIDPAVLDGAAARVWTRLAGEARHQPLQVIERIRSCADFQALMPDYRAGQLSAARALLLEDHTHECVACRKALSGPSQPYVVTVKPRRKFPVRLNRWAIAAAVVIAAGVSAWPVWVRFSGSPADSRAMVEASRGMLLRITDRSSSVLASGAVLPGGAEIRSTRDSSGVVRLHDGSAVELRERSAFTVSESGKDLTIHLLRGSIIVQAAKRSTGHLYVATRDCRVAVTGTVFGVNSGAQGSRVSVIEGEVRVTPANAPEKVLHPGDQFSTNPAMSGVPVQQELAWSRNAGIQAAMVKAFGSTLNSVHLPALRYSTRLLDMVPADTVIYAGIPNLGGTLGEARQIFAQKAQQIPELQAWLAQNSAHLDQVIANIQTASTYLGDEIVITAQSDGRGGIGLPVVLAEVKRPGLQEFIDGAMTNVGHGRPKILIQSGVAIMSPAAPSTLQKVGLSNFKGAPFHDRIAQIYGNGAGFLLAADLTRLRGGNSALMGMENAQYLILEQKSPGDLAGARAVVTFSGPRTGVASWLAPPAPVGTLDFVSPDALFACAFVVKNPAGILDELFRWQESINPNFRSDLTTAESKLGINVQSDLAATLGGDFSFAVDGPVWPVVSWKLAVEVYDPVRLQATIEKLIHAPGSESTLAQESADGRTYYTLTVPGLKRIGQMNYVFVDGYLLATPSRALLDSAIQYHATGYTLPRSAAFISLLPRDLYPNFSGMVYENAGPAIALLSGMLNLGPAQGITTDMKPMLIAAYGETDRITLAGSGNFLAMSGLMDMPHLMMKGTPGHVPALH